MDRTWGKLGKKYHSQKIIFTLKYFLYINKFKRQKIRKELALHKMKKKTE